MIKLAIELIPFGWVFIGMLLSWFLATIIEAARWKRHIKRFLPEEAATQIEKLTDEKAALKSELKEVKADRDHKDLQLKAIRGGLEL